MIANKNKEKNKIWISRTKQFEERYSPPNRRRSSFTSENPNENHEDYSFVVAWQMCDEEKWVIS